MIFFKIHKIHDKQDINIKRQDQYYSVFHIASNMAQHSTVTHGGCPLQASADSSR